VARLHGFDLRRQIGRQDRFARAILAGSKPGSAAREAGYPPGVIGYEKVGEWVLRSCHRVRATLKAHPVGKKALAAVPLPKRPPNVASLPEAAFVPAVVALIRSRGQERIVAGLLTGEAT